MKTSEMLAKLKTMASKAGEALFERASLATKVLADKEWLDAEFAGDHDKALAFVEGDCFPELGMAFSLTKLLVLVGEFPTIAEWREHKFNLPRLWAEHDERLAAKRGTPAKVERKKATIALLDEREEKIKELEWTTKQARETVQVKEAEIAKKETEIERLRRESAEKDLRIAALEGEVSVLNRMLERERAVAKTA